MQLQHTVCYIPDRLLVENLSNNIKHNFIATKYKTSNKT